MGQIEVYEWLKKQRKQGLDKFFTIEEVHKGLLEEDVSDKKSSVRFSLLRLEKYDYLEVKFPNEFRNWHIKFRLKEEYTKKK